MTTRGKILLTVILLAVVGFGVYRWWDKIAPQSRPQNQPIDVAKVKQQIEEGRRAPTDIPLLIEIKTSRASVETRRLIEQYGAARRCLVEAFDARAIDPFRDSDIPIGASSADVRRISAIRALIGERLALLVGVDDAILEGIGAGAAGWIAGALMPSLREAKQRAGRRRRTAQ